METNRIHSFLKTHYNLTGKLTAFDSYDDLIYRVDSSEGTFILKIYHIAFNASTLQMQIELMDRLESALTQYQIPAAVPNQSGGAISQIEGRSASLHPFLEGTLMGSANPISSVTRHSLGAMLGAFRNTMDGIRIEGDAYDLSWDNAQVDWIEEVLDDLSDKKEIVLRCYHRYLGVKDAIAELPKSVIHNDVNENNLFVQWNDTHDYIITGAIDFGDSIYTQSINDLAIACAYAMMGVPDPLDAAAEIIRGYHAMWKLQEAEVEYLFTLIGVRLINSLAHSTKSAKANPENEYILIHQQPTIDLLHKLDGIDPSYAHYYFRAVCGWEPVPQQTDIVDWIKGQTFHPIYDQPITLDNSMVWDLSVGSSFIGSLDRIEDTERFGDELFTLLKHEKKIYGIGRYDEVRLLYSADSFANESNNGPTWRTLHLGIDVFAPALQPVYAPLEGKVIVVAQNDLPKDYGHVIILEHQTDSGIPFYTLYGHLSATSLEKSRVGDTVKKGQVIAWLGGHHENGDWVPHIHFQIMTDLLGNTTNFPGVADPNQRELWLSLCPDPNLILGIEGLEKHSYEIVKPATLLEKRSNLLPKNLSVSFKTDPLHIIRGKGVYLYDHHAQAYLDTVNNVAHVGHENAAVVKAGQQQMAILNTNTRYLHPAILEYAEALLATLPDHLEVVYFCNSGSEANDLALRLAKVHTGNQDMVILEQGYHGHTSNCIDISSYKFDSKGGSGLSPRIHKLDMPDSYRGEHHENPSAYANDAVELINGIEQIAGFIGEPILSCGGQIVPPSGYFKAIYAAVRSKGGVCIADEVQTGFGRVGDHFWAFELHSIDPDIVTMGKPIGNGHPLAAVATTRAIADSFDNGMEYFNTYGGNPVSCTIGHAVLKYIQDNQLQSHAKEVGDYLIQGLKELQAEHTCIGDIRGHGLFLGIEFVDDADKKTPSQKKADYIAKRMKDHKIQMSTDGPDHNVIKIKPPMVFDIGNADRLLRTLKRILDEDYIRSSTHL